MDEESIGRGRNGLIHPITSPNIQHSYFNHLFTRLVYTHAVYERTNGLLAQWVGRGDALGVANVTEPPAPASSPALKIALSWQWLGQRVAAVGLLSDIY